MCKNINHNRGLADHAEDFVEGGAALVWSWASGSWALAASRAEHAALGAGAAALALLLWRAGREVRA